MTDSVNFFDLSRKDLADYLSEKFSLPAFRANQLFDWVYKKNVWDISQMSNLSEVLRDQLAGHFTFPEAEIKDRQISNDGTRKYLFQVPSGRTIETVLIKQPKRQTICVSSQYGCGMGCKFCRTGTMGFIANLKPSDIVAQVLGILKDAKEFGDGFQNIVFMGMGEPLHNYKTIITTVRILTDPKGLAISPRRITVSTVGLVPAIEKFAEADLGVNLAISLNATDDATRTEIMPTNKAFPIDTLLGTLKKYPLAGRKKLTIEYVMLAGVNDRDEDLKRLPRLLKDIKCKVNLIPYNENAGLGFKSPSEEKVYRWFKVLNEQFIFTSVRWSKGKDINAACGQLVTEKFALNETSIKNNLQQAENKNSKLAVIQ